MAAQPAYRYDYAGSSARGYGYAYGTAAPARRAHEPRRTPDVRVVPGRKHINEPTLSPTAVMVVKAIVVCLIVFLMVGFARVGLASGAYSVASASSDLRGQITEARAVSDSLAVEKGMLVSPANLREAASTELALAAPSTYEQLTLPADLVVTDAQGNLSLSGSIARVAEQG